MTSADHADQQTEARMRSFSGEPDLADVLSDPIVHALMRADRCSLRSLYESLDALRRMDAEDAEVSRPCGG